MEKEFDVEEIIDLPDYTIKRNIDGFTIILAPQYPNWIVLDEEELTLYNGLEKGKTIIQVMDDYAIEKKCDDEEVIETMTCGWVLLSVIIYVYYMFLLILGAGSSISLRSYWLKYSIGTDVCVPLARPLICFSRNSSSDLTA